MTKPMLEMRSISKTFGAIRALRDVSLTVMPGEGYCRAPANR